MKTYTRMKTSPFMASVIRLLLGLAMLLPATWVQAASLSIKAQVVDHSTREPIKDFSIEISKNGTVVKTQNIAEPPFSINFDYTPNHQYELAVKKAAYPAHKIDLSSALKSGKMPSTMKLSLGAEESAFLFKGRLRDRDNGEPIADSQVVITNKMTGEQKTHYSDYSGNYTLNILSGYEYDIEISNKDYLKRYGNINYCSERLEKNNQYCFMGFSDLSLDPSGGITAATTMMDEIEIGKKFRVDNIYYDYNKASLRPDALPNLDRLHHILQDNPQIIVELGSHADSRGSDTYNQELSQRRAQSAVDYITENDIDTQRITAKGYGEAELLNHCANGVRCSDSEHEANRRTEFTIIDIDETVFE